MAGPRTIREYIAPRTGWSAEASGRAALLVRMDLPTAVFDDEAAAGGVSSDGAPDLITSIFAVGDDGEPVARTYAVLRGLVGMW